ncbi:MAG: S8 family serine peptidase [Lagierella massiliensis]|nr:S8 family serine peptidase [Lagierella massiliensis]
MNKFISYMLAFAMVISVFAPSTVKAKEKVVSDDLLNKIEKDVSIDVLITFEDEIANNEKVDLSSSKGNQINQRKAYIENLKKNANISQKKALEICKENVEKVHEIESFYITNTIRVKAFGSVIKEILKLDNIIEVAENGEVQLENASFLQNTDKSSVFWDLENMNVFNLRDKYKLYGTDIVIGFLDSGVDLEGDEYKNPEIYDNWRGHTEGASTSWYDVFEESQFPISSGQGHGTAVVSTAVGENIGVAPKATWILARAFKSQTTSNSNILKAAQWFLAPGGRADLAPNIVNNSWGKTILDRWFDPMINAWINAGIIPVFSAGNTEYFNYLGSIDYPAALLDVISVGAVDKNNLLADFSGLGPSPLDTTKSVIKPDVVAPGVDVYAADLNNHYAYWSGTSFSTPKVSGVIALILQANRNLNNEDMKNILTLTASPLKDEQFNTSPNMGYGHGIVDALAGVELGLNYDEFTKSRRINGYNRSETSLEISKKFYENSDYVYITNHFSYADGLSMGSLTKYENGPLLLLPNDKLTINAKQELMRLNPKKIIIIGGDATIGRELEEELKSFAEVERVKGSDRIETSLEIARKTNVKESKEVFLVNGYEEADSINIVSVSAREGIPIVFSKKDTLSPSLKNFLIAYEIEKVTIIGGDSTVSESIEVELSDLGVKNIERLKGKDRFLTGAKVNQVYFEEYNPLFLANGYNIADALSVGPVLGKLNSPLQIVQMDSISDDINEFYKDKSILNYYVLGGRSSISSNNMYNIFKMVNK